MFNLKSRKAKIGAGIGAAILGAVILGACNNSPQAHDQNISTQILGQYEASQPVPQFKYSQIRATAIDIEAAQAHTTQTTTFFFNQGVAAPTFSCPSIGFPVAATTQLTNPEQNNSGVPIPQIDPNGIYAGDSTGTYVVCVSADGQTYLDYWEGFVQTVSGPAVWDSATNTVKTTGPSSVNLRAHK